jgi:hypothetical protein
VGAAEGEDLSERPAVLTLKVVDVQVGYDYFTMLIGAVVDVSLRNIALRSGLLIVGDVRRTVTTFVGVADLPSSTVKPFIVRAIRR